MKKTIIIAAALVAMIACNKTLIETPMAEYGTISLGVSTDTEMVVTKADPIELDGTAAANYIVTLAGSQKNWEKKYSEISADDKKMPAGEYIMTAKNISDADAVSGNGQMQLVSDETTVEVKAGKDTPVALICKIANSKVTVNFDANFTGVFTIEEEPVVLDPSGRKISMTPGAHNLENTEAAWFNDGTTVNWQLKATVTSTSTPKTYTGSFTATKAKWNQLTFKAGENGTISLVIKVDDTITVVPVSETIDPLS